MLANRARAALREQRSSKKLGVSSFLDFQGAWYALFEALNGLEQLGVARSSSGVLGRPLLGVARSCSELLGSASRSGSEI